VLLLLYLASAALTLRLAARWIAPVPRGVALAIALSPLLFTGKAVFLGQLYGPSDLYGQHVPWKSDAAAIGIDRAASPILSDLAFQALPWRAAVRDSLANGRAPLWNRSILSGTPLLGAAQAGVFHPSVWLGILLPVPLSFTFSCTYTLLLALLSAWLFFSDFRLRPLAALAGAIGWGFSTSVVFWIGWSVGPSIATLPLLLLGLRRIARGPGGSGVGLTAAALALSFFGGHPESTLHVAAVGAVCFLWELAGQRHRLRRAIAPALASGLLALALAAPALLPFLGCLPRSAEWRQRRSEVASGAVDASVPAAEAVRRMLPAILPFAHGIYGKSPVDGWRQDGSGMPLAYAGGMLFPLAACALLFRGRRERGRLLFAGLALAGILLGASAHGLIDALSAIPGFSIALNYRAVFLAGLGLAGLAAFGLEEAAGARSRRTATVSAAVAGLLVGAFLLFRPVFAARSLPDAFVRGAFAAEILPVLLFAAVAMARPGPRNLCLSALLLLALQRAVEMHATYPTLPASTLAPARPGLAMLAQQAEPFRVVAADDVFRPNASSLYRLQDVRGYESIVLDRYDDVRRLFSISQHASFNRVSDLSDPLLALLNVKWAIAPPGADAPAGWRTAARSRELTLWESTTALPRAFLPARVLVEPDEGRRLAAIDACEDFSKTAWLEEPISGAAPRLEGPASGHLTVRETGDDLTISVEALAPVLVATSVPAWPGWSAVTEAGMRLPLATVNHAFVGFAVPAGRHEVSLRYRPASFAWGLALGALGAAVFTLLAVRCRRRGEPL
jgi:hypothetical protein